MTAHVNVGIPHGGEGTHTLVIALEVDDQALSDPGLEQRVLDRVRGLIAPVLAERRSGPVADSFLAARGVTLGDMRAYDKSRDLTEIRHDLMLLLRRHGWSYPKIGELLHRDHTTVMAGVRKAEERARARPCEECGDPALGGGRWCGDCFSQQVDAGARYGCGTDAGYAAHRRDETPPCDTCRSAHAEAEADRKRRRTQAA